MELVPLYPVLIAVTQGRGRIIGVERDPDHAGVRFGLDPGCRPGSGTVTVVPPWVGLGGLPTVRLVLPHPIGWAELAKPNANRTSSPFALSLSKGGQPRFDWSIGWGRSALGRLGRFANLPLGGGGKGA